MPFIQNIGLDDIRNGFHIDPGPNAMLIQIVDQDMEFPEPKHSFKTTGRFKFLDIEKEDENFETLGIQEWQAKSIVNLLGHAFKNHMTVIVHCHAGICRSGAVCEVGVMMGFQDTKKYRQPNLAVKHALMKELGWAYSENEKQP